MDESVCNDPEAGMVDSDDVQIDGAVEAEMARAVRDVHDK